MKGIFSLMLFVNLFIYFCFALMLSFHPMLSAHLDTQSSIGKLDFLTAAHSHTAYGVTYTWNAPILQCNLHV